MKLVLNRRWFSTWQRDNSLAVRWILVLFLTSAFGTVFETASAQTPPTEKNSTRSISGQFIITGTEQFSPLSSSPGVAAATNLVRLDPALLAVSAERIKQMLWQRLGIKGQWRGQIYLVLHPASSLDENVTITAQHFSSGWNYRVELPDVMAPTRYARALTGVLLLEFANRTAGERSAEVPAWLTDGLSQQLLAAGSAEFLLSSPDKLVNGLPVTRLEKTRRGVDPLAGPRQILRNHAALTFEELSWPTSAQLNGDDDGVYRASAQLFISEILSLKNGLEEMRAMLESLPQFFNWQIAFRRAFAKDFPEPLDLEKWWALRTLDFNAHDPGPGWTVETSRARLDEILRVPMEVRAESNSLPVVMETSLQSVIRNLEPARQREILSSRLHALELAQLRVARPYASLTAEYGRVIRSYLGGRPVNQHQIGRMTAAQAKPGAASTIKKLDALDVQRQNLSFTAQPERSVQPSLTPLKF